jgi:hypothetical protein
MDVAIRKVYILDVEPPGDFLFTPSAIVTVLENGHFTIYSIKSAHNLYRSAISRHAWDALEAGVTFQGAGFRLEDVTTDLKKQGWTHASSIPDILRHFYETKSKYFFFLASYVNSYS